MVLKGMPAGESDKFFYILTSELGLIGAHAKSVRKSESKLAPGLEEFSYGTFSFIRGKHSWRITGVQKTENMHRILKGAKARSALVQFLTLIRRLVRGEEVQKELFFVAEGLFRALSVAHIEKGKILALESLASLRLLFLLGYLDGKENYQDLVSDYMFLPSHIETVTRMQKNILRDINDALKATQL